METTQDKIISPDVTQQAIDMVMDRNHVSFAELSQIEGFCGGELESIFDRDSLEIVIWSGLTRAGTDAIDALHAHPLIEMIPANPMTYLIDGVHLKLPILTPKMLTSTTRKKKKTAWLPVVFKQKGNAQ